MRNSSPRKTEGPLLDRMPHVPQRTCVGCRTVRAPQEFLRLACTPQGAVILDRSRRLPGRGVYVCWDVACLRRALKPARLLSAFKQPVTAPTFDIVYQAAVSLLQDRLKACFGLARKAGAAVSGYASLHTALAQAKVGCLVLTKDIAASRAEEYYGWCAQQNIPCVTLFSKEELGRMLGRPSCSAVGFTAPRFCELLYTTIASLGRLSAPDGFSAGASGLSPSSF